MGYVWFVKKLKRCCVLFRTYKKRFVIHDPELFNSVPAEWVKLNVRDIRKMSFMYVQFTSCVQWG